MSRADLISDFLCHTLGNCEQFPLQSDASFRRYIRVRYDGKSTMLMDAPPEKEDVRPFMTICNQLYNAGYSAPKVIASDADNGFLLLEDLGDDTFSRLLKNDITAEEEYYRAAIDVLAEWHAGKFNPGTASLPLYDEALLMREVALLANWFLPQFLDGTLLEHAQGEYVKLWQSLTRANSLGTNQFVHRDYHADNLMWLPSRKGTARVGLLDFQDAVMGDAAYDMVSLLEDARRDVPKALTQKMIAHYVTVAGANSEQFAISYALLAAQRNSKIVGIFTRLAARDGKAHYLNYLPRVWDHLTNDLAHPALADLKAWFERYIPHGQRGVITIRKNAEKLGLAA